MDLISEVLSSLRDSLVHIGNANFLTLGLVVAGILVVGYFLLRR